MNTHRTLQLAGQAIAVLAALISHAAAQEGVRFADVQLTQDGVLQGTVSSTGRPIASAVVEVRYEGKTIAVASSSADGRFAVSQVRPGVHEVVVGNHAQPVRIWACGAAPAQCQNVCRINVGTVSAPPMTTAPYPSQHAGHALGQPVYQDSTAANFSGNCPPTLPCTPEGCVQPTVCEPVQPWGARVLPVVVAGSSVAALILAIDARNAADDALAAAVASP